MVGDPDIYLGNNRLTVTLTASRGLMTLSTVSGLTFAVGGGDGTADAMMMFSGDVNDLNNALNGLQFIPEPDYFGSAWIDVLTNDLGQFTSTGLPEETDLDRIDINVISVNDPPSFDPDDPEFNIFEIANLVQNPPWNLQLGTVEAPSNDVVIDIGRDHLAVDLGDIRSYLPGTGARI